MDDEGAPADRLMYCNLSVKIQLLSTANPCPACAAYVSKCTNQICSSNTT